MIYKVPPPGQGLPGESALLASEFKSLSSETIKKNSKLLKDGPKGSRGGRRGQSHAISQVHISKFIQRWPVSPNLRDIMLLVLLDK